MKVVLEAPDFLITWLVSFSSFFALVLFYTYSFMTVPSVCIIITALGVFSSFFSFLFRARYRLCFPLAIALLPAVIIGSFLGLYVYDRYTIFPMFYTNSRLYTNVLPSQPSAAVSDAGKIVFSSESYVYSNQSVGFISETGSTYCAAPVLDTSPTLHVQFWAVGIDCCGEKSEFYCDSASNEQAHSGIVVFDNNGFFQQSRHDYYEKARLKAEAEFSLLSAPNPMYIRWVTDGNLNMLSNYYHNQAVILLVISCIIYFGVSAGLAYVLNDPRKRPAA